VTRIIRMKMSVPNDKLQEMDVVEESMMKEFEQLEKVYRE
jgi:hypothetical protein